MEMKDSELTASQDEKVTAGLEDPFGLKTVMHCDSCSFELVWAGDYLNGLIYNCPHCGAHTYHGIMYY